MNQTLQVSSIWHLSYARISFGSVSFPPPLPDSALLPPIVYNPSTRIKRTAEPVCSLFCDGHDDGLGTIFSKDAARCGRWL